MNKDNLIKILEKIINTSHSSEWWDDNIQPSARKKYDGNKLADKIEVLIETLKIQEND